MHILVEFVLLAHQWIVGDVGKMDVITTQQEGRLGGSFDWSHEHPPGLAIKMPDEMVSPAEHIMYFGWVWEERAVKDVLVATKANDAKMDLSIWNVGGKGKEKQGGG